MCLDPGGTPGPADGSPGTDLLERSPADILKAGAGGAMSAAPAGQSGASKSVNNPLTQGAASAAGVALAPATMGLSMLIPVAAKLFGGILGKKAPRNFGPPPVGNTDAGLNMLAGGQDRLRSFGGT